jgi:hypothetical protein
MAGRDLSCSLRQGVVGGPGNTQKARLGRSPVGRCYQCASNILLVNSSRFAVAIIHEVGRSNATHVERRNCSIYDGRAAQVQLRFH